MVELLEGQFIVGYFGSVPGQAHVIVDIVLKHWVPSVHLANDVCGAFQVLYQGLDFPQLFWVVHVGDVDLDLLSVARKMLLSGIESGMTTNSFFCAYVSFPPSNSMIFAKKNERLRNVLVGTPGVEPLSKVGLLWQEPDGLETSLQEGQTPGAAAQHGESENENCGLAHGPRQALPHHFESLGHQAELWSVV